MNKISPGSVAKFKQSGPAFLLMENVQSFLAAIKKYGVPDEEVFQTPDLFEARNIPQVTLCLYALARTTQKHPEYNGPSLGPKMATENKRNFSEEQIRQGRDGQVGLQVRSFLTAHTGAKILNLSKNSQFENLIFHKIHNFKDSFLTKFTFFQT